MEINNVEQLRNAQDAFFVANPVTNHTITKAAELLAADYAVKADKIYGKGVDINGNLSVDEERVVTWLSKGWSTIAFMADNGFVLVDVNDAISKMDHKNKKRMIGRDSMRSACRFTESDYNLVRKLRALHNKDARNPNQITFF